MRRCGGRWGEYHVAGIRTNLPFFRRLLEDECFERGELHTGFIGEFFARQEAEAVEPELERVAAVVAVMHEVRRTEAPRERKASAWVEAGRAELLK